MSFGLLSRFYENIKRNADRKHISFTYSLSPETLESLLQHCSYIRNLCAQHSRLWNRRFTITFQLPRSSPASLIPSLYPQEDRRLYNTLVILAHMVGVIEPGANWPHRLTRHLLTLKPNLLPHMGFPADWQQRPLWAHLLSAPSARPSTSAIPPSP
jgi:abortive infection bacteriophage resistance protein